MKKFKKYALITLDMYNSVICTLKIHKLSADLCKDRKSWEIYPILYKWAIVFDRNCMHFGILRESSSENFINISKYTYVEFFSIEERLKTIALE